MTFLRLRFLTRGGLAPAAVIAVAALAAGCSSSSSSTSGAATSPSTAGASSSAATDPGVAKAQQMVTQLEATHSYPIPTASITGTSKFKGRTVFYIPLDAHIPGFVITGQAMQQALAKAGLKYQECDGASDPGAMSKCISQAESLNAAGIILDAIPYQMIQNALDGAKAKGIPIIITDQFRPSGVTDDNSVAYVQGVTDQPTQIAWWMIANSQGKGNIGIGVEKDSPSSAQYVTDAQGIFTQNCSGCTITLNPMTFSETQQQIQTSVTTTLQTHPSVTYYYTEFEDSLQQAVAGIQAAGKSSAVALTVAGGSVNGLGLLKQGSMVKAVVAVDQAFAGWALTDEVLRMMTKSGPVTETFPSRLFTSDNIGSINVTNTDQSSGAWFGDNSFQSKFAALWGA